MKRRAGVRQLALHGLTNYCRLFPAGALLVPGATWPVVFPDVARPELPPVSEKSPGLPVVVPEEFIPGEAALVPPPAEAPPAPPPPAPPAPPPAPWANAQLEDIASVSANTIVVIFMIPSPCLWLQDKDHGHLTFQMKPIILNPATMPARLRIPNWTAQRGEAPRVTEETYCWEDHTD